MTFVVLYVCTGNVCRSPAAELLFRFAAAPDADVVVHSAGVRALEGAGVDPPSAAALLDLGVDPRGHRAQQFEPWMADRADLILTAERAHRDDVITAVPTALRRTFTMREFARLAPRAPVAEPATVVAHLAYRRSETGAVGESADSIPDPYRRSDEVARATVRQLHQSVLIAVKALGLHPRHGADRVVAATAPTRRPRPRPEPDRPRAPQPAGASRPSPGSRPRPGSR